MMSENINSIYIFSNNEAMNKQRNNLLSSRSGTLEYHDFDLKGSTDEKKRLHLLSKIDAIDKTLKEVRDIRGFKVSQSSLAPDVGPQDHRGDGSYTIDTTAPQLTTCPHCFKELTVRDLRAHVQKSCNQKMIQCPERGCGAVLPQNELKEHLKSGCLLAKKRRSMAAVSVQRKEDVQMETIRRIEAQKSKAALPFQQTYQQQHTADDVDRVSNNDDIEITFQPKVPPPIEETMIQCENCKDMIRENDMKHHSSDECRYRKIYCTNRALGCLEEVSLCEINQHLRQSCAVEVLKDQLVQRSRKRREMVQCPGCGDSFELQYLRKHEDTTCPNRKVHCRNHVLGCQVEVRLKNRKDHEDVTNGVKPRPCLFFDGQDTRMVIGENDITPPWTTELWVYRPSLLESCKSHMREVKRAGKKFRACTLTECAERVRVLDLKASLEDFAVQGSDVEGVERVTVQLDQQLALYEKAALDTCMFGQLLLVAATTAIAEINEVLPTRPVKDMVDIDPKPTGKLCLRTYVVKGIDDGGGKMKTDDDLSEEEALEITRKSQEINEQMEVLKKLLVSKGQAGASGGEGDSVEDLSNKKSEQQQQQQHREEGEGGRLTGEHHQETSDILPAGFDMIQTNTEGFDWSPKRWNDWTKMAQAVLVSLAADQVQLRSWRLDVGLLRMTEEELKALRKNKSNDDAKAKKEAAKAAKREKREKKRRKDEKDVKNKVASNFLAKYEGIQRMYSGSEPISVGPDACIYLNLAGIDNPCKSSKKSRESDNESEDGGGKRKEVKVQGCFGFADKFEGTHSFGVRVPRERWTHVVVKCTREPKKRIFVFSNAILVGTLKDHYFNLPMQSIGSEYLSLHGYLLDCRYWAKERSSAEIKMDMHHLLDLSTTNDQNIPPKMKSKKQELEKPVTPSAADMTSDQLISWWTFEDGYHNKSTQDISGNRFATSIVGGKTYMGKTRPTHWYEAATLVQLSVQEQLDNHRKLLTESTATEEVTEMKFSAPPPLVVPMPSFVERNLCPFEVKRAKLAQKGRALMKEAKCPLGCKEKVRKVDIRFHVKHECERRKVKCRFKFCGKTYMAMDAMWHESGDDCAAIRSRDEVLRAGEIDRKLYECDMCSEMIQSRHFNHHQENVCPHRLIRCPHADCDKHLIPAHSLQRHLEGRCRSAAVQEKKLLITRARASRSYARPWGLSIPFDENENSDSD